MRDTPNPESRWPVHFVETCRSLQTSSDPASADHARGQLWLILNSVIHRSVSYHASRYGGVPREEMEDIAAQKSLDLLNRIQAGDLDLTDRTPQQLTSFLSSVAENGLMDLFRQHSRTTRLETEDPTSEADDFRLKPRGATGPTDRIESKAYAAALRECAEHLESRARKVWMFRVFYDLSTLEISSHPEVQIKPGYVDVILQRVREAMRKCMRNKGHDTHEMPTGVFVEMWRAFRMDKYSAPARS
jgi:RNA polymerase sigma factor (sigma-70 family)